MFSQLMAPFCYSISLDPVHCTVVEFLVKKCIWFCSQDGPQCQLVVCGWKGKISCRSFLPKFERGHYLRLCGVELKSHGKRHLFSDIRWIEALKSHKSIVDKKPHYKRYHCKLRVAVHFRQRSHFWSRLIALRIARAFHWNILLRLDRHMVGKEYVNLFGTVAWLLIIEILFTPKAVYCICILRYLSRADVSGLWVVAFEIRQALIIQKN